ncbi:MAG: hypothetical protein OXN84_09395 [Albidovulum sp.]|nr:hypothetical protein [Albidovulum sp.]
MNPYCRISGAVKADNAGRRTAAVDLKALSAKGTLVEIEAGHENLYISPPLLALLTERERLRAPWRRHSVACMAWLLRPIGARCRFPTGRTNAQLSQQNSNHG